MITIPHEELQELFPAAWAKWAAFAMKIKPADFKEQDWFAVFFTEQGIEYFTDDAWHAFRNLEIKLT